jgi:hypothetical protein
MVSNIDKLSFVNHTRLLGELDAFNEQLASKQVDKKIIIQFLDDNKELFAQEGRNYSLKNKLSILSELAKDRRIQDIVDSLCEKMDQFRSPIERFPAEIIVNIASFLEDVSSFRAVSNEIKDKLVHREIMTAHLKTILPAMQTNEELIEYLSKYGSQIDALTLSPKQFKLTNIQIKEIISFCPNLRTCHYNLSEFESKCDLLEYISIYGIFYIFVS